MNTLESILKELISARVEQLAHEAEQNPDCVKSKEQMIPLRTKAKQLMGEDDAEELVSMAHGYDIPIYEHCYLCRTGGRNALQGDTGADEKSGLSFRVNHSITTVGG